MRKNLVLSFVILVVLSLFLLSCTKTPIIEKNQTITIDPNKTDYGDLVTLNYILSLDEDGKVVDTNIEEEAKKAGLETYSIGPYQFILGQSGKVTGFDKAVLGMDKGEKKQTIIPPSEKELYVKINKTKFVYKFFSMRRLRGFKLDSFEDIFGKKPQIGNLIKTEQVPWEYKIINMTDEYVVGEMHVKEKEKYNIPGYPWPCSVFQVYSEAVSFYQMPEENKTIETKYGPADVEMIGSRIFLHYKPELNKEIKTEIKVGSGFAIPQTFEIVEIADDYFTLKRTGLLTDKVLVLDFEVLDIIKDVKDVKPNAKKPNLLLKQVGADLMQ